MHNNTSLVKLSEKENSDILCTALKCQYLTSKKLGIIKKECLTLLSFVLVLPDILFSKKHDVRTCAKMLKNPEEINDNESKLTSLKIS